jgi:hypothetical protein
MQFVRMFQRKETVAFNALLCLLIGLRHLGPRYGYIHNARYGAVSLRTVRPHSPIGLSPGLPFHTAASLSKVPAQHQPPNFGGVCLSASPLSLLPIPSYGYTYLILLRFHQFNSIKNRQVFPTTLPVPLIEETPLLYRKGSDELRQGLKLQRKESETPHGSEEGLSR